MIIRNCFYKKPDLHRLVTNFKQERRVLPTKYVADDNFGYKHQYSLPLHGSQARNVEHCINEWMYHCVIVYMLDHPTMKQIDTKDCVLDRETMRKLILFGEPSPEYEIRSLKYVDDMIDVVEFLLAC